MALKLSKGRNLPIGLDVGSGSIKMIQLRLEDGDLSLLAAGRGDVPADCLADPRRRVKQLTSVVKEIEHQQQFKGRECIMSLPADMTHVQHVRIPKAGPAQIEPSIREELSGKMPFPVEGAILRYVMVGDVYHDGETKQEVIAVAASQATLEAYVAAARKAHLDVICVNVEPCAIVECFGRLFRRASDTARTILYLDLGMASTQVVLSQGHRMIFARNLRIGGQRMNELVAEGMGITPSEASQIRRQIAAGQMEQAEAVYPHLEGALESITGELTQCLRYFESVFRGQSIERAIFLGGQAYDKRLCQSIAKRLNVPAQIGDPLVRIKQVDDAGVEIGLDHRTPQPNWAVAVGLSLGSELAA